MEVDAKKSPSLVGPKEYLCGGTQFSTWVRDSVSPRHLQTNVICNLHRFRLRVYYFILKCFNLRRV